MNCGTANLCDVKEVRYVPKHMNQSVARYHVTWSRHITGLDVFSDKFIILFDLMVKESKSWEVGLLLSTNETLFLTREIITLMGREEFVDLIYQRFRNRKPCDVIGVVFDEYEDVERFVDRLEKKYIVSILKQ